MLALNSFVEKDLLIKLQSGDRKAFEQLYKFYSDRIYSRLLNLTRVEHLADELLQDTFVILWEKRHQLNAEQSCKAWLYKVAENELMQFYRKVARDKRLQEHIVATFKEAYSHTEEDLYLKESRELLNKAIDQLSPQRKQVFTLCKMEGKSYDEAAGILGISPFTVSNHLVKATSNIRDYLFHSKESLAVILIAIVIKGL
jgi:RNA polymerase sigma-70 factor (family 1)